MRWSAILSVIAMTSALILGLALIFWIWVTGTLSEWTDRLQFSMIEREGKPSFYYRNRWSDDVFFVRWQGDGLGRHRVKYHLEGVSKKSFELRQVELAGQEGAVRVVIGVTPEKDFYEDFPLPFKVSREPILKVSNYRRGEPIFITAQHMYLRNFRERRFDKVPVDLHEFRFIPTDGGEALHEHYIADSQRVFYADWHGQLSEVKTAKPADFRSEERHVAGHVVATDGVQRFHKGEAVSDEELARIEREYSAPQVVVEETYSSSASPVGSPSR
jgi:hypothetical protein